MPDGCDLLMPKLPDPFEEGSWRWPASRLDALRVPVEVEGRSDSGTLAVLLVVSNDCSNEACTCVI